MPTWTACSTGSGRATRCCCAARNRIGCTTSSAFGPPGRRLGPAVPLPVTKRADGVDYASSVARIYQKADTRPLVAGVLRRHFVDALTRHLRLRRNAEPREILTAWRVRHSDASARELSG